MFVGALRHHPTMFQLHNNVTSPHGSEPVSDEQDGEGAAKPFDGIHHRLFRGVVEGAGGFVKHQHTGLLVESARDANALTLAAGKTDTTFAHVNVVATGSAFDKIRDLCLASRLPYPVQIDSVARYTEGDVLGQCGVGQVDALWHVSDGSLPGSETATFDGLTIK